MTDTIRVEVYRNARKEPRLWLGGGLPSGIGGLVLTPAEARALVTALERALAEIGE